MKYGYTIIYVHSVDESLNFYKKAFGLDIKFVHESKMYGELDTGDTTLAFASHKMGELNLDGKYIKADAALDPFGVELAFVTDDVSAAFERAVASGALSIKGPEEKPWGQVVAYVRAIDGSIIELCSAITS